MGIDLKGKRTRQDSDIVTGTCPVPPKRDRRGQGAQYKMKLPFREAPACGRGASLLLSFTNIPKFHLSNIPFHSSDWRISDNRGNRDSTLAGGGSGVHPEN